MRRSLAQSPVLYHADVFVDATNLRGPDLAALPASFQDIKGFTVAHSDMDGFVDALVSVLLMVKLMTAGHPKSKPYYSEICGGIYPTMPLVDCERKLHGALQKYDQGDFGHDEEGEDDVAHADLAGMVYETNSVVRGTPKGEWIVSNICSKISPSNGLV